MNEDRLTLSDFGLAAKLVGQIALHVYLAFFAYSSSAVAFLNAWAGADSGGGGDQFLIKVLMSYAYAWILGYSLFYLFYRRSKLQAHFTLAIPVSFIAFILALLKPRERIDILFGFPGTDLLGFGVLRGLLDGWVLGLVALVLGFTAWRLRNSLSYFRHIL